MSFIDRIKSSVDHGLYYLLEGSKSNCLLKGVLSAGAGLAMGASFGIFIGTFEGSHGEMPGATMKEQLQYACKQTFLCTWRRCVNMGGTFCALGFVMSSSDCFLAKMRGKDDKLNSTISGVLAGGVWGGISARKLPMREMLKIASKCAATFVIFGWVIDYVIDSYQEKAAWTRPFNKPDESCNVSFN